jgi:hypothetical protein
MNWERSDRVRLDMARWEAEILLGLLVDNSFHVVGTEKASSGCLTPWKWNYNAKG